MLAGQLYDAGDAQLTAERRRAHDLCLLLNQTRDDEQEERARLLREDLSHREINDQLGEPGAYTDAVEAFMATLDHPFKAEVQVVRDIIRVCTRILPSRSTGLRQALATRAI